MVLLMSYTHSDPRTRTLLRPSHVNVIALPRPLQTQRSSSPSRRAVLKPPLHLQTMN